MKKVLYVPLDDRPCNYHYPLQIAAMCDDIRLVAPPFEWMGQLKVPTESEKIWAWLFEEAKDADYAILSVDTLVYGNIIHSRIHQRTMEQIDDYLSRFVRLKEENPNLKIHAFNLVARVAGYNGDFEDPTYWSTCGWAIWRIGVLRDKIARGHATEEEEAELPKLLEEVPEEYLNDFLARREKDAYVNSRSIDLVQDGIFDALVVPKDDTAEYGYAAIDQKKLSQKLYETRLYDKVMVYPGADEVGSVLFARVFNLCKNYTPRVYTRYSSLLGPTVVPLYEDRPIAESIKAQITSAGGVMVETAADSDLLFALHTPGKAMIECGLQHQKDLSFTTHTNLHEFFRYLNYYHDTYQKPVALSDVAFSNGSDIEMMRHAQKAGILEFIDAYSGWNTCENSNGMALAHGIIASYYAKEGWPGETKERSREFVAIKVFEDYLFQAQIIAMAGAYVRENHNGKNPYFVADIHDEVANWMGNKLVELVAEEFDNKFQGHNVVKLDTFRMPWNRIHELHFDLKLD